MDKDTFIKTNYHTHCTFCDGHNTAEEMVREALGRGFGVLGFSSHSLYPFSSDWHLPSREHGDYCGEIRRLAEAYRGSITVLCGFEADYVRGVCAPHRERFAEFRPDYIIGSVHYVPGRGGFIEADGRKEEVRRGIDACFKGNARLAVQAYFAQEREMLAGGGFDIIGHADLIRKQNVRGEEPLFDEEADWYRAELELTARAAAEAGVCVEINTGGMARGYMDTPFPSPQFLRLLRGFGVPATISSDAHRAEQLDYWFNEAVQYAKAAGYTELAFYTADGFHTQKI